MHKNLEAIIPILAVEKDAVISKQGDITLCYELQLPELFTLSDAEYEAFHQTWVKALKVLPVGTVLHKQDWFTESSYQPDDKLVEKGFLANASERFFNERP